MEPKRLDQAAGPTTKQSRREALKKFGRYAAVAPTAMVLLQPRASSAGILRGGFFGRGRGRGRGGGGNGDHGHY